MGSLRKTALAFGILHLAVFSISTAIAADEIESILASGWVCSVTGLLLMIVSAIARRPLLAFAGGSTILLAVSLFLLEVMVFELGPRHARVPFCVTFLIWELLLLAMIVRAIVTRSRVSGEKGKIQFDIRFLMATMLAFAIIFAIFTSIPRDASANTWWLQIGSYFLALVCLVCVCAAFFVKLSPIENNAPKKIEK